MTRADPVEVRRRAIWHDVRSVLAAAVTNVEFLAGNALPPDLAAVVREIENEVRLAADVIGVVSSDRDPACTLELDLRALLWVARRSGAPVIVDATVAPFLVRGGYGSITALVDAIVSAVLPGRLAALAVSPDGATCTLRDLDRSRADALLAQEARSLGLSGSFDADELVLRRAS